MGIVSPSRPFSQFAKKATGNVVCFSPSCVTGTGIKKSIIPIII